MIHRTPANYSQQPWKNGRGITVELWRLEKDGQLLARLSRASVVEDGPFSVFPGIERNLTVLSGPGFRLTGEGHDFRCKPLMPVAFPGNIALMATETGNQRSDDFNVMTARELPLPQVQLTRGNTLPDGGILALYVLGRVTVNGKVAAPGDLLLTGQSATIVGDGPVIAVRFPELPAVKA